MKRFLVLCLAALALLVWTAPAYAVEGGKKASHKRATMKRKAKKKAEMKEEKKEGAKEEKKEENKEIVKSGT